MIRKIIKINQDLCNGCGACVAACHEGAIQMVNGKAVLTREDYCDGLGDCLPACPTDAISFEEREAPAYDEAAVKKAQAKKASPLPCGCPGTTAKTFTPSPCSATVRNTSQLRHWPVQIKLLPIQAPYYEQADLLIAADCTAYAYANFHQDFIQGHITLVGCPKLDSVDYAEKLTAIFRENQIRSVTVARMEVPCCGGLEHAVRTAIAASGRDIPLKVATISTQGELL